MIKKKKYNLLIIAHAILLISAGCSDYDSRNVRQEHIKNFSREITEKSIINLSVKNKLILADCIRITLDNNLTIKAADIEKKIGRLNKNVAFSNFLPSVTLGYNYTQFSPLPKIKFGNTGIAMQDNNVNEVNWQIQLSIFNPATWYMYDLHKIGEEISNLVYEYTKQMTVLEVTYLYYNCLSLQRASEALESQLVAAAEIDKKIRAFYDEGLASQSQLKNAHVLVLARETELKSNNLALGQLKSQLLKTMGLSPLSELQLEEEICFTEPEGDIAELVTEALYNNKQLYISDAAVAIEKEKVKIASSAFVPMLVGFAQNTWTSDALMVYENYWAMGLSGVLTVFDGFKNINEYKAAKENHKKAFIKRENQTLIIMLEVIKAKSTLDNAKKIYELAQAAYEASCVNYTEVAEKFNEGLIDSADMLQAAADKDRANMEMLNADFQLQVSIATLINAMGKTEIELEKSQNASYFKNN